MTRWLIDGMNVIGSRPDGWWRDRDAAKHRLVERLAALAARGEEVTVVFDGRAPEPPPQASGVEVLFAPGGPNSADQRIVGIVEALERPAETTVVTSDGPLAERVGALGAAVTGAGAFRRRLEAL